MARQLARLSAIEIKKIVRPGMYPDGGGLYLQVSVSGSKSWIYRYAILGREREMGLGPYPGVTLAEARGRAEAGRAARREGADPIEMRRLERQRSQLEAAKALSFREAAESFIRSQSAGWRNDKHCEQWRSTLNTYAYPVFGDLSVQNIDVTLVMKVIEPIWVTKTETASRLRGRIEKVLDWANARGYREGENPARWRGLLQNLLPKRAKVRGVRHHPAMPYKQIRTFMSALRKQSTAVAQALDFLILTAGRTGEVTGMTWDEVNFGEKLWSIPAERMKAGKSHRVPLSEPALSLLRKRRNIAIGPYVFPGRSPERPMSNMAMLMLMKRMNLAEFSVHGFRSSFRDWVAEETSHTPELAEMALAHTISNKVEAAYRRGDLLEKRQILMREWSLYCSKPKFRSKIAKITEDVASAIPTVGRVRNGERQRKAKGALRSF